MAELGITVNTTGVTEAVADLDKLAPAAARAEAAATKLAQTTSQQFQKTANDAESMAKRIEAALNIRTPQQQLDINASRAADIEAYGRALDQLRMKFNQAHSIMTQYREAANEIRQAHAVGAISINEMESALSRLRITTQNQVEAERKLIAQRRTAPVGTPGSAANAGGGQSAAMAKMMQTNMMYQFQDVAVTTAMGMNPFMIALQQGTQLGMNMSQAGGVKAGLAGMAAGLGEMLSISNLLPIAIVGVGAAFYQWLTGADEKTKSLNELTKEYTKSVNELAKAYGVVGTTIENIAVKSEGLLKAQTQASRFALEHSAKQAAADLFGLDSYGFGTLEGHPQGVLGGIPSGGRSEAMGGEAKGFQVPADFQAFSGPIEELFKQVQAGNPDFDSFAAKVQEIIKLNPQLAESGSKAIIATKEAAEAYAALGVSIDQVIAHEKELLALQIAQKDARTDAERLKAAQDLARFKNEQYGKEAAAAAAERARTETQADIDREHRNFLEAQSKQMDDALAKEKLNLQIQGMTTVQQQQMRAAYEQVKQLKDEMAKADIEAGSVAAIMWDNLIQKALEYAASLGKIIEKEQEFDRTQKKAQDDAQIRQMQARTDAERIAAAADAARAGKPAGAQTDFEASEAGRIEAARIEKEHADATRQRHEALDDLVNSQQLELDLLGKTNAEQAAMRKEYELITALQKKATESGIAASQTEIDLIHQKVAEYKKLTEELEKQKLVQDVMFERQLLLMSPDEASIARRLHGTGIGMNDPIADAMRENDRITRVIDFARDTAKDFLGGFAEALTSGGDDMGKKLVEALVASAQRTLDKILDRLLDDIINTILFGSNGAGGGGTGGIIGTILGTGGGGGGGATTGATGTLVGELIKEMSKGNLAGGSGNDFLRGGTVGDILKAAGTTSQGIALSQITSGSLTARVATQYADRFQGLLDDLRAKGYPITSLGEGGYSRIRMTQGPGGGGSISRHSYGEALDINPRQNIFRPGATGNFSQYGIDPNEEAQKFGLKWGGSWRTPDTMHFQVDKNAKSLDNFTRATDKATDITTKATDATVKAGASMIDLSGMSDKTIKSLSTMAGGMENFGSQLSTFLSSASGGGSSWFKGLMGSFGGAGGALDFMSGISPAATMDILTGIPGLYHSGGIAGSPQSSRYVSSMLPWFNAVRLHRGNMFAADEYPAVLRKGEPVFPSMAAAQAALGGKTIVNVHNYGGSEVKVNSSNDREGQSIDIIVDRMQAANIDLRGTASNNTLRSKFALNERMKMR